MGTTRNPIAALCALALVVAHEPRAQSAEPPSERPAVGAQLKSPFGDVVVRRAPSAIRTADVVLWACTPNDDQLTYLLELQRRFGERGLAIAVVLDAEDATALAAREPHALIAVTDADVAAQAGRFPFPITAGLRGSPQTSLSDLDGARDVLEGALDDGADLGARFQPATIRLLNLLSNVADGGPFAQQVELSLEAFPHSGRAHGCAVLYEWFCTGDLEAGDRALERGIAALRDDSLPLVCFADLVLRGDRNHPTAARQLLAALEPHAEACNGVLFETVRLRALLRAGEERQAGRVAATLPKRLRGDAEAMLVFAETLMDAPTPMVYRDLAERTVQKAAAAGGNQQWVYAARHKILTRCHDDAAAAKLLADYHANNISTSDLNNDSWYLMVRPATLGRFDTLALAQCKEMQERDGNAIDYNSKDTVAMSYYLTGHVEEAAKLQSEVKQAGGTASTYVARLRRYEEMVALLARTRQEQEKQNRDR